LHGKDSEPTVANRGRLGRAYVFSAARRVSGMKRHFQCSSIIRRRLK
jgi:hypothetical protein